MIISSLLLRNNRRVRSSHIIHQYLSPRRNVGHLTNNNTTYDPSPVAQSTVPRSPPRFSSFSSLAHDHHHDNDVIQLFPTKHSRKLPPPVCPPSLLQSQVESIFEAPIGSLLPYPNPTQLRTIQQEIEQAYYASDAVVQRIEYILRGLNYWSSRESFVSRSVEKGVMMMQGKGESRMSRQDCFRAMIDLMERMEAEGEAYVEMRTRIRSQLGVRVVGKGGVGEGDSGSSDSSSSEEEEEEENDPETDEEFVNKWTQSVEERMLQAGFANPTSPPSTGNPATSKDDDNSISFDPEEYQFGAPPGTTIHMFDLVLDTLACFCREKYSQSQPHSNHYGDEGIDLIELLKGESPPAFAKNLLESALHMHWMDGGDIGLGSAFDANNPFNKIGHGIGSGAGTGSGSLVHFTLLSHDVRTCPTPMTFNAVLRVAAEFDPKAHAVLVEEARILSGSVHPPSREPERLRDVTIDAAFSAFTYMKGCTALTLRSLPAAAKHATSRHALRRQAKLIEGKADFDKEGVVSGRNSATYLYMIRALSNCIPPGISRGNIAFGLYHKACVEEGVMEENLVRTMMRVGGYEEGGEDGEAPPVSNGPLFDAFLQRELGPGVGVALEKGRKLRQDRNYKMRRHVPWDDCY